MKIYTAILVSNKITAEQYNEKCTKNNIVADDIITSVEGQFEVFPTKSTDTEVKIRKMILEELAAAHDKVTDNTKTI